MTFLFMGRSGCGKGTQSKLLIEKLAQMDPSRSTYYLQSGEAFRELVRGPSFTSQLAKPVYEAGGLQPEFLAVWVWSNLLMQNLTGNEHLVMDGQARKLREAEILESAFKFYKREKPTIIYINVSREWASQRLMERKRADDTEKDIAARMDWFELDVAPAIDFFENNAYFTVLEIMGEQPIEKVHEDIMQSIEWQK
jgi:adenylate kinase family enzyme